MTRLFAATAFMALSMHHLHCQEVPKPPAFEVASITASKPGTPQPLDEHTGIVQYTKPGGRFNANAATLTALVEWAYSIQPSQHSGGPSWLASDRYDVAAKAGGNATDAQMKVMLQALLVERFQLKVHHESRRLQAYVVSVGKTPPKLVPAKDDEAFGLHISPQTGSDQKIPSFHVTGTRFTVAQLIDLFARHLDGVVVNEARLDGQFDFALDLTPDESQPNPMDAALLMEALRKQLGFSVEAQKEMVDFLVIDGAEKVVAGNQ